MSELDDENDYTLVFDHFYTNNHIQILKSLLPFFDDQNTSFLPILIKYLELQHIDPVVALFRFFLYHLSCLCQVYLRTCLLVVL